MSSPYYQDVNIQELRRQVEDLNKELDKSTIKLNQATSAAYGTIGIIAAFTGDKKLKDALRKVQRAIAFFNMLKIAALAAQAATGPWGVALAAVGAVGTIATGADMLGTLADVQ